MNKIAMLAALCALLTLTLTGCQTDATTPAAQTEATAAAQNDTQADALALAAGLATAAPKDIVEIKEKMFVAQTNDVYFNANDYLGKTIKYEGIFKTEVLDNGERYHSVIRYGPGCCGIDANAGFEVRWDRGYPLPDDWVEAVGVLERYTEDGNMYLRLALSSLTVLPTRGLEVVTQ